MIYKKDANFPYPLLTNTSNSYNDCNFSLDIDLRENSESYRFEVSYDLKSSFICRLLEENQAQLILVIQSKDNKFFELSTVDTFIEIPKSRISLTERTQIQLLIQSKVEISFVDNNDLNSFYQVYKSEIIVPKNSILGFSNSVIFDGSNAKPLELFEKKVNPNIKSAIKIELGVETIIIHYKNEEFQFVDSHISNNLNNPYVYMGLQKALMQFIYNNCEDGEEEVDIVHMEVPSDGLDLKLYNIMQHKLVEELSVENIDEVIYLISDKIIEKYTSAIRRLYS
ncbi:hypothetical protein V7056_13030 [Bacillus sp. JJ664]